MPVYVPRVRVTPFYQPPTPVTIPHVNYALMYIYVFRYFRCWQITLHITLNRDIQGFSNRKH